MADVKNDFRIGDEALKPYINPEIEIVEFDNEDVITTSDKQDTTMPWIPLN